MKRSIRTAIAFAFASFCLCSGAVAKIVTYQFPSYAAVCQVTGINDKGQAVGHCSDKRTAAIFGFLLQPDGAFVKVDVPVPMAKFDEAVITLPTGINAAGVITGWYYVPWPYQGGFARAADGSITTVQVGPGNSTALFGTNKRGWTVGQYSQSTPFFRDPTGATQEFQVPGASGGAAATVVNRSRAIAGSAIVNNGTRAFFRPAHGTAALFGDTHYLTNVAGINDAGTVVGWYQEQSEQFTAFVRTSDGTFTTFVGPYGNGAQAHAINNSGTIVGTFVDRTNASHSFIRAADGTFTDFNLEGGTYPQLDAINNKGAVAGVAWKGNAYVAFAGKP